MQDFISQLSLLEIITDDFLSTTGLEPRIGIELEFYLDGVEGKLPDAFKEAVLRACEAHNVHCEALVEERGKHQYELILYAARHPFAIAQSTVTAKDILHDMASHFGYTVRFEAQPYHDRPGSSMHVSVSLWNSEGHNLFAKDQEEDVEQQAGETQAMQYAIGGLMAIMPESMIYFAPERESYERFQIVKQGDVRRSRDWSGFQVPINVSWGGNNRTCAIRIPDSTRFPEERHLEHRVAGADANPFLVCAAVLAGILYGFKEQLMPQSPKLYGSAYDHQYDLEPLPLNIDEAREKHGNGKVMPFYLLESEAKNI